MTKKHKKRAGRPSHKLPKLQTSPKGRCLSSTFARALEDVEREKQEASG